MAWSAPMTAVANTAFTASQFNTYIRDNLLETSPAKALNVGSYFVTAGVNKIEERRPSVHRITSSETCTTTAFVDLATGGPAVTVATGPYAFVTIGSSQYNNNTNGTCWMGFQISGATTLAASVTRSIRTDGISGGANTFSISKSFLVEVTPGSNIFTSKYRVGSGTGTYFDREISVLPF